ncbi:MAG: YggS family pyridoxal phosphate-dependent enzyme [Nitrospirae bacterium]|nr:YggS family pyridoxal phosphate-dependent enzyme [Candidatus Troglogloeales bacterium]MBI3598012.1 YggS family pyridoxal phosphate-dependent enzyme [Candidatus Troglogloeales bacterium]
MGNQIAHAVANVLRRIGEAAGRAGRDPQEITLVAVSKGVSQEAILAAANAGVTVFGENRVQEAIDKFSEMPSVSLHFLGSLQMNKVKKAVGFFDIIHSIDSIPLAEKVEEEAMRQSLVQDVLIQVNIGEEATKGGVSVKDFPPLLMAVQKCSHLKLLGLMAIPPITTSPRPYFVRLRKLGIAFGLTRFSIGMSSDFEVAIEEGASWVRIGATIFGSRPQVSSPSFGPDAQHRG